MSLTEMNALVLHGIGDLRYEKMPVPEIGNTDVLVKVKAAGICSSDIPRAMVTGAYHHPLILGHEFAGEVVETGDEVKNVKVGDRVAVFPLIPCRKCCYCQIGEYAQCDNYDYLGSRCDGGFAEYVRVPSWNLVQLPKEVEYEEAALTEPISVGLHALRRTNVDIGDAVAVMGSGPIGIIIAQWAKILGAGKVFIVDVIPEKLEIASKLGFKNCINAKEVDPVKKIIEETEGLGVDLAVESAGSAVTFEQCLRVTRKLGNVVFMGNIGTDVTIPKKTASTILRNQLTMYGIWNSSFAPMPKNEWVITVRYMEKKKLNIKPLISHKFKLRDGNKVFDMMYKRREFFNKVIFAEE